MRRNFTLLLLLLATQLIHAQGFTEVSEEAGINHAFHVDIATFGGGVVVFDYNNDGYEDLYLTGGNLDDALYRNNGDGTFSNVFENSGLESTRTIHSQGAAAADIDRDGDKDLIVTSMYDDEREYLAPNLLFLNNGDGTFTDVTEAYGLSEFASNSQGASFGDINADGYPDLYVANYIAAPPQGFSIFNEETITNNYASAEDYIFINAGGKQFIEVSGIYGMVHDGFGFEGTFTDWDNDRDLDIMIANDFGFKAMPNVALRNNFPDKSLSYRGNSLRLNYGMNAMGIAAGDYNFDGWMDYFVSNISASLFVVNDEGKSFEDIGYQIGLGLTLIDNEEYQGVPVSWGANFFDYDHDQDVDLFVNNGALNPTVRPNHNFFFRNNGETFDEIASEVGVADPRIGRGSAVFDYDNDGDLDIFVVNQIPRDPISTIPAARCLLYRNDAADGNWLKVQLAGTKSELNGLGSRVEVVVDGRLLIREIDGGSSHLSQNSTIAHFGLGDAQEVESVTVKWVGGKTQSITNVAANQLITIEEEEGPIYDFEYNYITAYPTVFTDQILIEYELQNEEPFDISVYDAQGRLVETLTNQSGVMTGFWQWNDAAKLAPGVYVFQLRTKDFLLATKAVKI